MIGQYTQAAMVAENRRLAVPASADTLPTSAMQEDHVSLGWAAARKLRTAVANLARILAVELVAGSWGVALRRPLRRRPAPAPPPTPSSPPPADPDPTPGWHRGWPPSSSWSPTARWSPPCPVDLG